VVSAVVQRNIDQGNDTRQLINLLRHQEVRATIRGIDPLMLRVKYHNAARDGSDPDLIAAIETAPTTAPLLSREDLAQGRQLQAERERPNVAVDQAVIDVFRSPIGVARQSLKEFLPPAEPILLTDLTDDRSARR
jgi:hypothetical protein